MKRYVLASDFDGIAAELAECRNSRQREHGRLRQAQGRTVDPRAGLLPALAGQLRAPQRQQRPRHGTNKVPRNLIHAPILHRPVMPV